MPFIFFIFFLQEWPIKGDEFDPIIDNAKLFIEFMSQMNEHFAINWLLDLVDLMKGQYKNEFRAQRFALL